MNLNIIGKKVRIKAQHKYGYMNGVTGTVDKYLTMDKSLAEQHPDKIEYHFAINDMYRIKFDTEQNIGENTFIQSDVFNINGFECIPDT